MLLYLEKALEPLIARCARLLARASGRCADPAAEAAPPCRSRHPCAFGIGEHHRRTSALDGRAYPKINQARAASAGPRHGIDLRGIAAAFGRLARCLCGTAKRRREWARQLAAMWRQDAEADARRAPAGRGPGWPEQLVERLRARLGEDAVYGVVSIAEHRPEAAWRRVQELRGEKMADHPILTDRGMPRPVWLLAAPLPLESVFDFGTRSERIESGWWDGKGVARDYYIARQTRGTRPHGAPLAHGARLWVFQERRSKRWYLHGVFA